jgi:hypothetical protein
VVPRARHRAGATRAELQTSVSGVRKRGLLTCLENSQAGRAGQTAHDPQPKSPVSLLRTYREQ